MAAITALTEHWLVAEDSPVHYKLHCRILKSLMPDNQIICVIHGDEALKAVRSEPFNAWEINRSNQLTLSVDKVVKAWDVFILDCNMPISIGEFANAGIVIAQEIRKTYPQEIPVYACSSDERVEFDDPTLFTGKLNKLNFNQSIRAYFPVMQTPQPS